MIDLEERLACLRGVGIFAATPDQVLLEVAAVLCPVAVEAGQTIFNKGDAGDSLYIIVEGRVGVFDGQLLLNHLNRGAVFGEMAVLDAQPRSASVTAIVPTRLHRLDQGDFRRLLSRRFEVTEGVIAVLCQRLRGTNSDRAEDFEYLRQVAMITSAAQDLEVCKFRSEALDEVTQRTDALGQLARVFQQMAREVQAREEALKQQVRDLRIEIDQALQARQVSEIVGSDYFIKLQQQARSLRRAMNTEHVDRAAADSAPPEDGAQR